MKNESISNKAIYFLQQQATLTENGAFKFLYNFNSSINAIQHQFAISQQQYKATIATYLPDDFNMMTSNGWLNIKRKGSAELNIKQSIYKLYVGVNTSDVLPFIKDLFSLLNKLEIQDFKIPETVSSLKRCDKIILYFPSNDSLIECAEKIIICLTDYKAQQVPFTEILDNSGFLSKGVDPAYTCDTELVQRESWRSMICKIIANSWIEFNKDCVQETFSNYLDKKLKAKSIDSNSWSLI